MTTTPKETTTMSTIEHEDIIEIGGQAIAVDDFVKVKPSAPGKKDGFIGVFRGVWMDEDGTVTAIDVWGDKRKQRERMRSFRPERIEILSTKMQNKLQKDRERRLAGE